MTQEKNPSPALQPVARLPSDPQSEQPPSSEHLPKRAERGCRPGCGGARCPPRGPRPALRRWVRSWGHLVANGADCFQSRLPLPAAPAALAGERCPPVSVGVSGSREPPGRSLGSARAPASSGFPGSHPASRGYVSSGCPPRMLGLQHLKHKLFDFFFFFYPNSLETRGPVC